MKAKYKVKYDNMITMHKYIYDLYHEYFNDYLTIERFAEHKEISTEYAAALIAEGKRIEEFYTVETEVDNEA